MCRLRRALVSIALGCALALAAPLVARADEDVEAQTEQGGIVADPEQRSSSAADSPGDPPGVDEDADLQEPQDAEADVEPDPEHALAPDNAVREAALAQQRSLLEAELRTVDLELAGVSTVGPWTVIVTGAAIVLTGALIGTVTAVDCEGSCSVSPLAGVSALGGATIGLFGIAWLHWVNTDQRHLDSQRHRLTTELQRMRWQAGGD